MFLPCFRCYFQIVLWLRRLKIRRSRDSKILHYCTNCNCNASRNLLEFLCKKFAIHQLFSFRFTVENITETDLQHVSIEFSVWDHNRIAANKPLGQVKIGHNMAHDNYHWAEMIKNDGNVIKMKHPLREN